MPIPELSVEVVSRYSPEVAAGVGALMPQLDLTFPGSPIPEARLSRIIESPYHDQIVARLGDRVVGTANMTEVMGAGFGARGQLEDLVVDEAARGQGVGTAIWRRLIKWCRDRGLSEFYLQTETFRPDAIGFYEKVGATILPDSITYKVTAR